MYLGSTKIQDSRKDATAKLAVASFLDSSGGLESPACRKSSCGCSYGGFNEGDKHVGVHDVAYRAVLESNLRLLTFENDSLICFGSAEPHINCQFDLHLERYFRFLIG